jgi:regulator of protease activity HflC (stomatin/prohibitin superfamily)
MDLIVYLLGASIFYLFSCIRIVNEYERAVVFRLGHLMATTKGPGLVFIFWPFDREVRVGLRVVTLDVPPQDIITKDNVSAKINAVCYYKVSDSAKAIVAVEHYHYAISQMAQTTLRSVIGQCDLDQLLSERDMINLKLQTILDKRTDDWGIKVEAVEIKDVDFSQELRHAMARQAEAERERRAKIIAAEGESQAAEKLCDAAKQMEVTPIALQLRYLQTLVEIGGKNNTTTVFPLPIDFMKVFMEKK